MKSKITRLYDYAHAEIPAELRTWRVSEEEIDRQLDSVSRSHAQELDAEQVQNGDSVVCRGESAVGRWNKPVLLFYPGSGLCEKVIEDALAGMRMGESRTVAAGEGEVKLTVKRIVRRQPHPIGDELVKLEGIEGAETVEDYRRWYRESTQAQRRKHHTAYLARCLMEEIGDNSEYYIDQEEENAWVAEFAGEFRKAEEAQGIDPTVPEEGTDFLTEEQVQAKYEKRCRPIFRGMVANIAIAMELTGKDEETVYQEELKREAEVFYHMDVDTMLEKIQAPKTALYHQAFQNAAMNLLLAYSEKLLEE